MSLILTQENASRMLDNSVTRRPSLLVRLLAAIAREIRARRDMRQLSGLDEAALHDIGLTRGGIEDAVRYGRSNLRNLAVLDMTCIGRIPRPSSLTEWN